MLTAKEVAELCDYNIENTDKVSNYEKCDYCGLYFELAVEGSCEIVLSNGESIYDCCETCLEMIIEGKVGEIVNLNPEVYEDYLEEEDALFPDEELEDMEDLYE